MVRCASTRRAAIDPIAARVRLAHLSRGEITGARLRESELVVWLRMLVDSPVGEMFMEIIMRYGMVQRLLCASIAMLSSALVQASPVLCSGTVNSIALQPNGKLLVSYGHTLLHSVCNVNSTYFDVEKDTCKAWLAVIQAAKAQQRTIRFYFESPVAGNPSSCAAITSGQETRPTFLKSLTE